MKRHVSLTAVIGSHFSTVEGSGLGHWSLSSKLQLSLEFGHLDSFLLLWFALSLFWFCCLGCSLSVFCSLTLRSHKCACHLTPSSFSLIRGLQPFLL